MNTLDELAIKKHCNKYGYSFRCFPDNAIIMTDIDEWRIKLYNNTNNSKSTNKFIIEHHNRLGNKTGKMQFHSQRHAPNLEYVFDIVISRHETYGKVFDKAFRIKNLLATM